ncbi:MAG: 5'-nucleotidase C-terminal domain-containing protein [Vicinamibacteraceae bacterium]|nr:5'-nucleotidase C-terminal domain-containing protein [Vicinamibacteraceae bacterium]
MASRHVTIIQQNDIHAQMETHWEVFWRNGRPDYRRAGGLARAASVVKRIREETRGACLFVDCGDTIHGTGPAQWTEGQVVVPVMNALGVTCMTPGNWEFGFGPAVLRERVSELACPTIACNVSDATTGKPEFLPSIVKEAGGLLVGLVGVTSPIVTETMPEAFGAGLRIADPLEALPRAIARLRREHKVDLLVVVSHVGLPQELRIAREVEGIDVLLSSHTHNRLAVPLVVGRTVVIQSGFSGSFLGCLDIGVEEGRVTGFTHELVTLDESIELDPEVDSIVKAQLSPFRERTGVVLGETRTALNRMTVLESTMDNLLTDAYLDLTGADVAFSHGWRYGAPVVPGEVTLGDLWQIVPTNPDVVTMEMTGEAIRTRLEASLESVYAADPMRQKGGYVIRVSGLHAVVRLNNPKGARVEQLDIAGAPAKADRVYRVAAAGEQALEGGQEGERTGLTAVEALERYFARHSPVEADLTHARFVAV